MKPKDKKAWLEALRSGEYKQGRGKLCRHSKYCCLGVAYDVLIDGDWISNGTFWGIPNGPANKLAYLPKALAKSIGLSQKTQHSLSLLNDNRGSSFEMIADWIEKNL